MGETIALQFDLAAETVQFTKEEIGKVRIKTDKDYAFLKNQYGSANLSYQGDLNRAISIEFIEHKSTTRAKIDSIIDENAEMTLYHEYRYDPTATIDVILVSRENIKKTVLYYFGEKAAMVVHILNFLESS